MSALLKKMLAVREQIITHGDHKFTVRVPSDGEMEDFAESLNGKKGTPRRWALAFTVDWSLQEIDLVPGGSPVPVPFDVELFADYLGTNPDLVTALFVPISEGVIARKKTIGDSVKN